MQYPRNHATDTSHVTQQHRDVPFPMTKTDRVRRRNGSSSSTTHHLQSSNLLAGNPRRPEPRILMASRLLLVRPCRWHAGQHE